MYRYRFMYDIQWVKNFMVAGLHFCRQCGKVLEYCLTFTNLALYMALTGNFIPTIPCMLISKCVIKLYTLLLLIPDI